MFSDLILNSCAGPGQPDRVSGASELEDGVFIRTRRGTASGIQIEAVRGSEGGGAGHHCDT